VVDSFCGIYKKLCGKEGMTNYFHLLYAGHYAEFLLKYKNLYRYSQQGWENVNSLLKRTFHRNTARGGGTTNGNRGSSKLMPVMFKLLRAMMWRCGHLDGLFNHLGYDDKMIIEYGKKMQMPKFKNVTDNELLEYAATIMKFIPSEYVDQFVEDFDVDIDMIQEEDENLQEASV
jgi:hypothetical protein